MPGPFPEDDELLAQRAMAGSAINAAGGDPSNPLRGIGAAPAPVPPPPAKGIDVSTPPAQPAPGDPTAVPGPSMQERALAARDQANMLADVMGLPKGGGGNGAARKELAQANQQRDALDASAMNLEQQAADRKTEEANQAADTLAGAANEAKAVTGEAQQVADEGEKQQKDIFAQIDKDVQKLSEGVDSNRFWNNASTGKKVRLGIASFLGGLGASLQIAGGNKDAKNLVAESIQQDIERDIEDQRSKLAQLDKQIAARRGNQAAARQAVQDKLASLDMRKVAAYDIAAKQVDALSAKAAGPEAQERAARLKADLMARRNEEARALAQKRAAMGGNKDRQKLVQSMVLGAATAQPGAPGASNVKTSNDLAKYSEKRAAFAEAQNLLDSLNKEAGEEGKLPGTGPIRGRVGGLARLIGNNDTALSEGKMNALAGMVLKGDSGATVSEQERAAFLQSYGLSPTATADEQRQGRALLAQRLADRQKAIDAGFDPEVISEYQKRAGAASAPAAPPRKATPIGKAK